MREISARNIRYVMDQIILFTILSIAFFSLCITALVILKKQREEEILNLENFKSDFKESNLLFFDKNSEKNSEKNRDNLSRKKLVSSEDGSHFVKSDEIPTDEVSVLYFKNRDYRKDTPGNN